MQTDSMTEIIFDFFASQIEFGCYKEGGALPSISHISRQFQVSALTVRTALARLRERGYIETRERVPATVIYQPAGHADQQNVPSFLARKEGINDICRFSGIVFNPIIRFYFQNLDLAAIKKFRRQLKKASDFPVRQITHFYAVTMQSMENPLALNLHWEVVRYLRLPYLQHSAGSGQIASQAAQQLDQVLALILKGSPGAAADKMLEYNSRITKLFLQNRFDELDGGPAAEQLPFRWQIYRDHPQLCYTLATKIMSRISRQIYHPGQLLPSCQAMAREFGVSQITMRRTLELLSDMRSTVTINGVGTKIAPKNNPELPNFSHPQIQKSLLLSLRAMRLCAITCKDLAIHVLSPMDADSFRPLIHLLQEHIRDRAYYLTAETCLRFIGDNSPSAFIREVCSQLYHLLLWGHALRAFIQQSPVCSTYEAAAAGLLEKIRNQDISGFASLLSELFFSMEAYTGDIFLHIGLEIR